MRPANVHIPAYSYPYDKVNFMILSRQRRKKMSNGARILIMECTGKDETKKIAICSEKIVVTIMEHPVVHDSCAMQQLTRAHAPRLCVHACILVRS